MPRPGRQVGLELGGERERRAGVRNGQGRERVLLCADDQAHGYEPVEPVGGDHPGRCRAAGQRAELDPADQYLPAGDLPALTTGDQRCGA